MIPVHVSTLGPLPIDQFGPGDFYSSWNGDGVTGTGEFGFVFDHLPNGPTGYERAGFDLAGPKPLTIREFSAGARYVRPHMKGEVIGWPDLESLVPAGLAQGNLFYKGPLEMFMVVQYPEHAGPDIANQLFCINLVTWQASWTKPSSSIFRRWQLISGSKVIHRFGD